MGRHVDSAETPLDLRRTVRIAGLLGGLAWVVVFFLQDPQGGSGTALLRGGAVLLTVPMLGLGMRLVRSDFLALRLFVAIALPTLVWAVFGLLRSEVADQPLIDAVFGAMAGLASAAGLVRGAEPHATH
jgi:hypothetical protein